MMQSAQSILRKYVPRGCGANPVLRSSLPQPKMRTVFVVVADVFRKQTFQMAFIHRNDVIQQISSAAFDPTLLCLARIKSAFEMNNIQRGRVTCYMEDIQLLRSFGEGHATPDGTR